MPSMKVQPDVLHQDAPASAEKDVAPAAAEVQYTN
jgi:hypothetical protein